MPGRHPFKARADALDDPWAQKNHEQGKNDRLCGQHIPLSARLVAIADVYDALRSQRVYKPAFPHREALRIMFQESPGHFDPALLKLFDDGSVANHAIAGALCGVG